MKTHMQYRILCAFLCLVFGATLAQQPGMPLPKPQIPGESASETKPAHHEKLSNKDVDEKLRKGFDSKNAAYAGSSILAAVDDRIIMLTGTVNSQQQHEMALQLARAYSDDRKIVDRLNIQP